MKRMGETKKAILRMLTGRQHTLTELSRVLHLSPSTVKQHLSELHALGAVFQVKNEFIKRWKYYRVTQNFEISGLFVSISGHKQTNIKDPHASAHRSFLMNEFTSENRIRTETMQKLFINKTPQ